VVTNKDESASQSDGSKAGRKSDLRGFVNDAIVKSTLIEDSVVDSKTCCRHDWTIVPSTSDLLERFLSRCRQRRKFLHFPSDLRNRP
jgi:hypothetical protein